MIKKKINLIASFMILTLIIVIIFIDNNVLNSLYMKKIPIQQKLIDQKNHK